MSRAREFADLASSADAGGITGKNLIINGAMQVAQRGTSSTDFNYASVDRFKVNASGTDQLAITQEQSSDSPTGFENSYKITVDTPETDWIGSEFVTVTMFLEQQDLTHLNYGSSDALSTTLSFWVKSSVTGTYSIGIYVLDTTNRIITKTYTINSTNTWEYKTITIEGDTNGSGFANSSSERYGLYFGLTAGPDRITSDSTSWGAYAGTKLLYGQTADVGSVSGATWQITGVQLEVGSQATPFEHRSYGDELARCQRYYSRIDASSLATSGIGVGSGYTNTLTTLDVFPPVFPMRTAGTATLSAASTFTANTAAIASACSAISVSSVSDRNMRINFTHTSDTNTTHGSRLMRFNSTSGFIGFDAEL